MVRKYFLALLMIVLIANVSFSQVKAVVFRNLWNNDLNSYNPKEFLDKVISVFKEKLAVNEVTQGAAGFTVERKEEGWDKKMQELIKAKSAGTDTAYFIVIASELRLPTFNLGKFIFKNPPRSSKLTFTFHIYDGTGTELMGDTIINRGCLIKTIDAGKGSKFFYTDYKNFLGDMDCHLAVIKKILQEKPWAVKPKKYMKT